MTCTWASSTLNRIAVQNPPDIYVPSIRHRLWMYNDMLRLSALHARVLYLQCEFNMDPPSVSPTDKGGRLPMT